MEGGSWEGKIWVILRWVSEDGVLGMQVFCCRAGGETGGLDSEELRGGWRPSVSLSATPEGAPGVLPFYSGSL